MLPNNEVDDMHSFVEAPCNSQSVDYKKDIMIGCGPHLLKNVVSRCSARCCTSIALQKPIMRIFLSLLSMAMIQVERCSPLSMVLFHMKGREFSSACSKQWRPPSLEWSTLEEELRKQWQLLLTGNLTIGHCNCTPLLQCGWHAVDRG